MKYMLMLKQNQESVKSIHPCESVIQTMYDIVKAHGGELKMTSETGKETGFTIYLPI